MTGIIRQDAVSRLDTKEWNALPVRRIFKTETSCLPYCTFTLSCAIAATRFMLRTLRLGQNVLLAHN